MLVIMEEYACCWYCDNLVAHPGYIGLLHLDFPRCFILFPDSEEYYYCSYDEFTRVGRVNWLDPSEQHTAAEREAVIRRLWNFAALQEREEEKQYNDNYGENE